ncbi:salivaricin M family lantibiotic [Streptococcus sp. UMB1203]|uniref:salivaricin M family lantibiotic n=1 Tax=Streptococcus sp. UMB1203 TaxID=3046327 RepID=UPI0033064776
MRLILWIMEINSQELDGKSAAGWSTTVRLTAQGHCGLWFTYSYECTSPNVRCG